MQIFLVGGSVRDHFLGRPQKDRDFVVLNSSEEEFLKAFPKAQKVGKFKPVFLVGKDEYTLSSCASIEEELLNRDLTINALALDEKGKLYTLPTSLYDLENKILRIVRVENFFRDPLRVYRCARFWAELPDFKLSRGLIELCFKIVKNKDIEKISAERVGVEFKKALQAKKASNFFRFLNLTSSFDFWFEELKVANITPAGPLKYHPETLLQHLLNLMDGFSFDFWGSWLAFCHDLGKLLTPIQELPHHYQHTQEGEKVIKNLVRRLKLPHKMLKYGVIASRYHMQAGHYLDLRPGTKVRLLLSLPQEIFGTFFKLVSLDQGKNYFKEALEDFTIISKVKLPPKYHNLGPKSGEVLHSLRAKALVKRR